MNEKGKEMKWQKNRWMYKGKV